MKLLYTIIALLAIQFVLVIPLEAALKSKSAKSLAHYKLQQIYKHDMSSIDKEFAENCYNLSEHLLRDQYIQQAKTTVIQKFKQNIKDFINNYNFYKHNGLFNDLVTKFSDITGKYYYEKPLNDLDSQYISKLLKKHGYDAINLNYEQKFEKLVKEKVLTEFEGFARKLPAKEKLRKRLLQWALEVKQCLNYDCYDKHFDILLDILYTPKDDFFDAIAENLDKINITYIIKANEVLKSVYKDDKLKKLSIGWHRQFMQDIHKFLKLYETSTDTNKLDKTFEWLHYNVTLKYYNNTRIPFKDRQLLKDILNKNGFGKMEKTRNFQLYNFIHHELFNIFEEYKASLNREELEQEKDLWQWYDKVKRLKTYEEKIKAFDQLLAKKED